MQLLFLISDKSQKWTDIVDPLFWETSNWEVSIIVGEGSGWGLRGGGGSWNSRDVIGNGSSNLGLSALRIVQLCGFPNWPISDWHGRQGNRSPKDLKYRKDIDGRVKLANLTQRTWCAILAGGDNWAKKHGKWHRTAVCEQLLPEIEKAESVTPQTSKFRYRRVISDQWIHWKF